MTEKRISTYAIAVTGWTLAVLLLYGIGVYLITQNTKNMVLIEARALFNKDKAARFWASDHGGVYVPKTEKTPSNPFLAHVPDRDITLTSGKELTLMNPAYMLREMMTDYEKLYGVKGHITGLIHYRPETAPDAWETSALKKFEAGSQEVLEISDINGRPYLRLMQPLIAGKSCLKCHGIQGYKEGDLRGGVSLSVPMERYYTVQKEMLLMQGAGTGIVWLAGIIFIGYLKIRIEKKRNGS